MKTHARTKPQAPRSVSGGFPHYVNQPTPEIDRVLTSLWEIRGQKPGRRPGPTGAVVPFPRKPAPEPFYIGAIQIYDFVTLTGFRRWNAFEASHRVSA